jgi:hypothetical protein
METWKGKMGKIGMRIARVAVSFISLWRESFHLTGGFALMQKAIAAGC